jgi:hypothetical protein
MRIFRRYRRCPATIIEFTAIAKYCHAIGHADLLAHGVHVLSLTAAGTGLSLTLQAPA